MPYCFSRSSVKFQGHAALKIVEFHPNWVFPDCNSSLNSPMAMKCYAPVPPAGDAMALIRRTKKITDTQQEWMAMLLRMMSRMKTWPLRIHGTSGVCTAYIPQTRDGQRDSMAYGGRMYSAWAVYMPNLWIHLIICELWLWHLNVHVVEYICI